jgi:hypothetical protein
MNASDIFIGGNVLIVALEVLGVYADPAIGLFNRFAVLLATFLGYFLL